RDLDVALGLVRLSRSEAGRNALLAATRVAPSADLDAEGIDHYLREVLEWYPDPDAVMSALARLHTLAFAAAVGWSCGLLELVDYHSIADLRPDHSLALAVRAGAAGKPAGLGQLLTERGSVAGLRPELVTEDGSQRPRYRHCEGRFVDG